MTEWKDNGIIRIGDDVVAVISSIATVETDGIVSMSSGIAEGITKRVSGKQIQKGINVHIEQDEVTIDVRVIVKFGIKIDQVCRKVQQNVKEAVENMTGLHVKSINVRVEGVEFNKGKALEPNYQYSSI